MENPTLIDDESILPVTHHEKHRDDDNDYDDYNKPNTSRVDETSFTTRLAPRINSQLYA